MNVSDLMTRLEEIAPPRLADRGDRIGLQVGDPQAEVSRVIVAVDPTPAVVDYAVDAGAEMLITHHPLIFDPLKNVVAGDPDGDVVRKLITGGVSLYVMHTNLDSAPGGINDTLAERLGVHHTRILTVTNEEKLYKLVVYVPEESVDEVRDVMAEAGAGHIGNYSYCSFRSAGTGTFLPLPGSEPYIGDVGSLEEVTEYRLEMIVPEWRLNHVVQQMVIKHPYEEVAYDIIPLANRPIGHGLGRIGTLDRAVKLKEFVKHVEDALGYTQTRVIGDPDRPVEIVALCGGAGKSLIRDAHRAGANVYVTGDVGHHEMLAADALRMAVIDASHYYTERPGMEALAGNLDRLLASEPIRVEFRL